MGKMFSPAYAPRRPLPDQNLTRTETSFYPHREDVERYRRFRALSTALNHRILKTVPRRAYEEIGDALGIRRNGVLVFDNEDVTGVLMDCCIYDWLENGKNVVQRYAETVVPPPETDESYVLQAMVRAGYRVLLPRSAVPGAGLYCKDILNGGELFLMDLAISLSFPCDGGALATRTIPLGEFWMTSGAALPIDSETDVLGAMRQLERDRRAPPRDSSIVALSIVRACLAAGAADHVVYARVREAPKKPRRNKPGWRGTKRRRH